MTEFGWEFMSSEIPTFWRVVPGAPLMMSALKTSFCGIGAISEGSFVVVGTGLIGSDEKVRASDEVRKVAGLAMASVQARRSDI